VARRLGGLLAGGLDAVLVGLGRGVESFTEEGRDLAAELLAFCEFLLNVHAMTFWG
jgi:hypothetical protein